MLSEEEKKALDILLNEVADIVIGEYCTHCKICENKDMECRYIKAIDTTYNLAKKQQKLINIFISNEAVREDKDFNEIKEKYYECL